MTRVLRTVLGGASAGALVVVLGLVTWSLLPTLAGWRPTVVLTGSMAPRVLAGDVVVSAPPRPQDLVAGRVLLVTAPTGPGAADRRLVVHRVQSVRPDGSLVTRGDANPAADADPVPPDAVVGVPRLRIPSVGLPVVWLDQRRWPPLLGVVGGLALLTYAATSAAAPADGGHRADGGRRRAQRRVDDAGRRSTRSHPRRGAVAPSRADGLER